MIIPRPLRPAAARGAGILALAAAAAFALACGKKGDPLPPLRLVPAPASDIVARRAASEVELRFTLPTRNQNGPGPIDLDRVEIYAITMAAGSPPPANRLLLRKERLVGTVRVRPAPPEGEEAPPEDPSDMRPRPGEPATFVEELTAAALTPVTLPTDADERPVAAVAAPAAAAPPAFPARIYALRGMTRSGRPGPAAQRVVVPLVDPPPAPSGLDVKYSERQYLITWIPPVLEAGGSPVTFNVYAGEERLALNQAPLTAAAFEHGPVAFGEERCYRVRSVQIVQNIGIESAASAPVCVAARDVFAPAAPKGLQVVAGPDGVSLSWDANTEADLGGYIVLRGEAPGDTLQPLTTDPVADTGYRDTSVRSGVRYVYALIAVDKSTPRNTSAQSERQEVTAR